MSVRVEARPSVDRTLVTRVAPAVLVVSGTLLFAPFPGIRASIAVPLAVAQLGPAWAVLDLVAGLLLLLAGIGAWLSGLPLRLGLLATFACGVVYGLAGLRDYGGRLVFHPNKQVQALQFRLTVRGQLLAVEMKAGRVTYQLERGDGLTIYHVDERLDLRPGQPVHRS